MRAVCLISADFAPWSERASAASRAALAAALARRGIAVHVIAAHSIVERSDYDDNGVTVHLLPANRDGALGWSQTAAAAYRELDALVGFDLVLAPASAEAFFVTPAPTTMLLVLAGFGDPPPRPSARQHPEQALVAAAAEMVAGRADCVLSPNPDSHNPGAVTLLPAVTPPGIVVRRGSRDDAIELVYTGELSPEGAPERLIALLGALRRADVACRGTFLGLDSRRAPLGDSYRRAVLLPAMRREGLDHRDARFIERCQPNELAAHLAGADAAIVPGRQDDDVISSVATLAAGVSLFVTDDHPLTSSFDPGDGVFAVLSRDGEEGGERALGLLMDRDRLREAALRGARLVGERFAPDIVAAELLAYCAAHAPVAVLPAELHEPRHSSPRLGAVVVGDGDDAALLRSVNSLLSRNDVPFELAVLSAGAPDALPGTDPRLIPPRGAPGDSYGAALNAGLAALSPGLRAVALVAAGAEVLAGWWKPFVDRLEQEPGLFALAAVERNEQAIVMIDAPMLDGVGRFDEDGDRNVIVHLLTRAGRLGYHFAHTSCDLVLAHGASLGALPAPRSLAPTGDDLFVVLADAAETVAKPELLRAWSGAFTAADAAVLALYGPGLDPERYIAELTEAAAKVGFDLEGGPRLVAKLPPARDPAHEARLAEEAYAVIGDALVGRFNSLPRLAANEASSLRVLAARAWSVRAPAESGAV